MVSRYLNRQVRDRLSIARDLARSSRADTQTLSVIADGLNVMFAACEMSKDGRTSKFTYVSNGSYALTGYWPMELVGKDCTVLRAGRNEEYGDQALLRGVRDTGEARAIFRNRHKNGGVYSCSILAMAAGPWITNNPDVFFAFMGDLPVDIERSRASEAAE